MPRNHHENAASSDEKARQVMRENGFEPDFPPELIERAGELTEPAAGADNIRDLRDLLWSSIDNRTSRDLPRAPVARGP